MLVEAIKGIVNVLNDHETILWSNSAPTSAFAGQNVTLSDDINNYDLLKVKYRIDINNATEYNNIIPVEDVNKGTPANSAILMLGMNVVGVANYARIMTFSNNIAGFANTYKVNTSGSDNNAIIPLQIIGIKKATGEQNELKNYALLSIGGGSNYGHGSGLTDNADLYTVGENIQFSGSSYTSTITVKEDGDYRCCIICCSRGNNPRVNVVINGVTYQTIGQVVDVTLSANDTITFNCVGMNYDYFGNATVLVIKK